MARLTSPSFTAFRADTPNTLAIHREAPAFVDQSTDMEMLVTGIKVRPAQTPEPAATDRRTRRTSDRAKRARNGARYFFTRQKNSLRVTRAGAFSLAACHSGGRASDRHRDATRAG